MGDRLAAAGGSQSRIRTANRSGARRSPTRRHPSVKSTEQREESVRPDEGPPITLAELSARVAVSTLVVLGVLAVVAIVWIGRVVFALLFFAIIIASAVRPGVEWLQRWRVPRGLGVVLHYAILLGLVAGFMWLVIPAAIDQVQGAIGPEHALRREAKESTGVKHELLLALDRRLNDIPSGSKLLDPALEYGRTAFEVLIGAFFVLATAAYWTVERARAVDLVCSLLPRPRRKTVRDTWELIDLRLGAFVRGQSLLIAVVGAILSLGFWVIGLPYWLLLGVFAGIVEIVPVIGPLIAAVAAIGVGLSVSTHVAVLAGLLVLGVRLFEDYLLIPRVLGHSVGLSPLVVLVSVTLVGVVFGGFAVILAVPLASVAVTLIDVIVRDKDPAEEDVPAVVFPAQDADPA
jgi:predicted PurR-regulated permease PerM